MKFGASVRSLAYLVVATLAFGCEKPADNKASAAVAPAVETTAAPAETKPRASTTGRIVAIGDVHGDVDALRNALRKAELIDAEDHWSGGATTFVQTGDILDRGVTEREAYDLLFRLRDEAAATGGRVILLTGNHEIMNAMGDLRYIVPDAMDDFDDAVSAERLAALPPEIPPAVRGRLAAWAPGGPYALKVSRDGVIAVVGDSVFVHGGVTPTYAPEIDAINSGTSAWLKASGSMPSALVDQEGPVWTRRYSNDTPDCASLEKSLATIGAKRMIVGHTVQRTGITSACNDMVWRIDTGMSKHYGGLPQALEIQGDTIRKIQ